MNLFGIFQRGEETPALVQQRASNSTASYPMTESVKQPKVGGGGYQRIEDWDAEQKAEEGALNWEQKVQFDGLRMGNQVRQNDILRAQLGRF